MELARNVLTIESQAISALASRLDQNFVRSLDMILGCTGRVIVSGIGKSGHIARKIASTMSSTGTPAYFVHPAEASHGDLGLVQPNDLLIALSYSGETSELLNIIPLIKRQGAKLIAITGNAKSTLAVQADAHLDAHRPCPRCAVVVPQSDERCGGGMGPRPRLSPRPKAKTFSDTHTGRSLHVVSDTTQFPSTLPVELCGGLAAVFR